MIRKSSLCIVVHFSHTKSRTNNHSNSRFNLLLKELSLIEFGNDPAHTRCQCYSIPFYFLQSLWVSYFTTNHMSSQGTIYVVSFPQKRYIVILTISYLINQALMIQSLLKGEVYNFSQSRGHSTRHL